MRETRLLAVLGCLALGGLAACESVPDPRLAYQDQTTMVQLRNDPQAGSGHSHPSTVTVERMTQVLRGVRVQRRGDPILSLVTGKSEELPAFSSAEIQILAAALSQALAVASPYEMVTFYRRNSEGNGGVGSTSGGLFMEGHQLYFVLANFRNRPSDVMSQAVSYEFDPMADPLMSLRARSFSITFSHTGALVPSNEPLVWKYVDPGKFFVVDLDRLPPEPSLSSSASLP